jgi:hypothetical protein
MRDPGTGWIQLDVVEFYLVWSTIGLGETPPVLDLLQVGRTPQRRAELIASASDSLGARDLGSVDAPAADLAAMLRSIADADVSLDMRVFGTGAPLFGCAGAGPRGAAVAARVGDEIRVGAVRASAVAGSLLGSLPPIAAAAGRPANVSVADYEAACDEGVQDGISGFVRVLRAAGLRGPEAGTLAQALTTRQGGGQLGATGRSRNGRPFRTASVVNWLDTPEGRYALRRHGDWLTITPVDVPRLTSMAEEMLADVRVN